MVRVPTATHRRLKAAAGEDGLTFADELARLLDLRREFTRASLPRHPLARPSAPSKAALLAPDATSRMSVFVEASQPHHDSESHSETHPNTAHANTPQPHTDSASHAKTPRSHTVSRPTSNVNSTTTTHEGAESWQE